jgi:carboxyl-terminal processing protease
MKKTIVVVGVFILGVLIGNFSPTIAAGIQARQLTQTVSKPASVDIKTFWKVWEILDTDFVTTKHRDPSSTDEDRGATSTATTTVSIDSNLSQEERRIYGAIKGMVDAEGDPYTTFFTPAEAKSFETEVKGSFEGVGMEVGKKDGVITVITPLPGSPSEKAGIKAGDKIIKIDKLITTDMSIDTAIGLIRGTKGTEVVLSVYREGVDTPLEIKIIRDKIELPTLSKKYDPTTQIYTIKIYSFSEQVVDLFKEAIAEFKDSGSKRLIIDLRGNPGGYLDAAVQISSYFIPQGKIVVSQDYGKKRNQDILRSLGYTVVNPSTKIVVLVDGGSASASEILAGALQDYKLATIVGQKTFGKGSVQEYLKVTPTTGLKVTIARWLTPLGRSISVSGLTPDVEVKNTVSEMKNKVDPQYEKAVEILTK